MSWIKIRNNLWLFYKLGAIFLVKRILHHLQVRRSLLAIARFSQHWNYQRRVKSPCKNQNCLISLDAFFLAFKIVFFQAYTLRLKLYQFADPFPIVGFIQVCQLAIRFCNHLVLMKSYSCWTFFNIGYQIIVPRNIRGDVERTGILIPIVLRQQVLKHELVCCRDGKGLFCGPIVDVSLATRFSNGPIAMNNIHL